jgi:DNA-binding response OmpR family regulator
MQKTILVVDDEKLTRQLFRLYFTPKGYDIVEAANGREALEIIEKNCPNLVIMDVLMPDMDGFSTVRHIRSKLSPDQLPVIFLTSRADYKAEAEGFEAGAQRFLVKPIHLDFLLATVKELIVE